MPTSSQFLPMRCCHRPEYNMLLVEYKSLCSIHIPTNEATIPWKGWSNHETDQGLFDANFICDDIHSEWLSNIVLIKKDLGMWKMCLEYTYLYRACPKDSYPFPNKDKLVMGQFSMHPFTVGAPLSGLIHY